MGENEMSQKTDKRLDCLPAEFKDNLTIFPDGYGVGTSEIGDIITVDFTAVINGKTFSIKRYALTTQRAKDLVKNLNQAIERCETKDKPKTQIAESPKLSEKAVDK